MRASSVSVTLQDDGASTQTDITVSRTTGTSPQGGIEISAYIGRTASSSTLALACEEAEALYSMLGMVLGKKS